MVSFFVQCKKMQSIILQIFNIQTWFSQFLWFFSLKCWWKGHIRTRIHLSFANGCVLIEKSMEIGMLNFWSVINCLCHGTWNSLYKLKYSMYLCKLKLLQRFDQILMTHLFPFEETFCGFITIINHHFDISSLKIMNF